MSREGLTFFAAFGSFGLLAGAFLFQVIGYPPCAMCLWQRWPHAAAILIGVLAIRIHTPLLQLSGAIATATTAGIGAYHTGVERKWWEGPSSCTGGGGQNLGSLSGGDLLATDGPILVMCDQVSWEFLTLSMATWNMLISLGLCTLWISAALTKEGSSRTA
ncbi:Disulfide bond formation protein DsbB [Cognatiyoonia koreensis]|uniref:Disulfide bond formation protein DsbB n=1 Tax=Cognatiyoonia koreensis TaxID=364200 RepID=A0A1I0P8M8_9RHOB|nr:disulfide bond formation protein B [Cognatiyoonia koreensis]SEW10445.1 Disulfide bond formation protein DsbB [Cognatiyoonia koreensis]